MTLSKERLEEKLLEIIKHGGDCEEEEMIRRLLAAEEQQPVAWEVKGILCHSLDEANRYVGEPEPLYLHPQQGKAVMFIDGNISSEAADKLSKVIRDFNEEEERPLAKMARIMRENPHPTNECDMPKQGKAAQVPEDLSARIPEILRTGKANRWEIQAMANSCRAAMLSNEPQNVQQNIPENISSLKDTLQALRNIGPIDVEKIQAERDSLNEPVSNRDELNPPAIPDSWKLVPSEATAEMIWAAKYVMSSTVGWDSFKEAYRAMIAAAPQSVPEKSKSEKFDIALSRSMENNKDTLAALAKK